ncbi:MAG: hypothetical protein IKP54_06450 [Bacteroidales bacterium]|nr:hypothetical protein [Bacteroidales bacterium]
MSTERFQNRYRIASVRAQWHNYDGGIFFVTICTQNREQYFGKIIDGIIILSAIGNYVEEQLHKVTVHYPYAEIPLWVIMPNHVHAIIKIDGNKIPYKRRDISCRAAARHGSTKQTYQNNIDNHAKKHTLDNKTITEQYQKISTMQGWLSVVVGGLKSAVSRFAHQNNIPFKWQTRFHDHIIRNWNEIKYISQYIENNVIKWEFDKFHTI